MMLTYQKFDFSLCAITQQRVANFYFDDLLIFKSSYSYL